MFIYNIYSATICINEHFYYHYDNIRTIFYICCIYIYSYTVIFPIPSKAYYINIKYSFYIITINIIQ